ncbi:hypothetical protein ABQE15_06440 [Enterococcus gallinarum]|uniref:hypothetical protein n=1 Tax=Enterococcus gallinarum TaxID=1353 RepID=UPI0022E91BFC|nr:hypothetical protein [Enterococcus gallinarum]
MTVIELREVFPTYGDTLLTAGQLQQPSDSQFVEELMLQTFFCWLLFCSYQSMNR